MARELSEARSQSSASRGECRTQRLRIVPWPEERRGAAGPVASRPADLTNRSPHAPTPQLNSAPTDESVSRTQWTLRPNASDSHKRRLHSTRESCWTKPILAPGHAEGISGFAGSMAEASTSQPNTLNFNKRQRLSRLLDKLCVQLHNNNNEYPAEEWSPEDQPLDLSIKHEQPPPPPPPPVTYTCKTCGQTFAMHDRLAKHIASRHRNRVPEAVRMYECEICLRRFARSDMLTRHARLHSGLKPYSCSACGQVFSRSDHLATHQRTHTGEKPYQCPSCSYAACRRDMITRHMRTHSRRPQPA